MSRVARFETSRTLRTAFVGVAVTLALVLSACGGGDDGNDAEPQESTDPADVQTGGKITFGIAGETDGWVPQVSRWGPSALSVARALYDPLAVVDEDGVAKPYLVERIEPTNDFKEWHIYLRDEEIFWQNGEPLTAEDIATNLKEQQLSVLAGNAYDPIDTVIVQTENPEVDWDVQVNLNERWATFPNVLTNQTGYMVYPPTIEAAKTGEDFTPMGTGPFSWQEWIPDDHLTVVRNDNYWRTDSAGNALPYLNEVEFRPIPDPSSRENALTTGELNMLATNSAADVVAAHQDLPEGQQLIEDTSAGDEMLLILNTSSGDTADLDVRRAMALAIDRQAIVDRLYDGYFEIADSPYSEDSQWYSDPDWPDPDPEEALSIVEAWEAENGTDLTIDLTLIQSPENLELVQVIQQQLEDAGIDVKVSGVDEAQFSLTLVEGNFEAVLIPFFNRSDPDAEYHFVDPFRTGAETEGQEFAIVLNFPRYTSEVTQEALPAARQTDDADVRAEEYARVWEDWAENFPYLFIYHMQWIIQADDTVNNLATFTYPDGEPAAPIDWGAIFLTDVWLSQ